MRYAGAKAVVLAAGGINEPAKSESRLGRAPRDNRASLTPLGRTIHVGAKIGAE